VFPPHSVRVVLHGSVQHKPSKLCEDKYKDKYKDKDKYQYQYQYKDNVRYMHGFEKRESVSFSFFAAEAAFPAAHLTMGGAALVLHCRSVFLMELRNEGGTASPP